MKSTGEVMGTGDTFAQPLPVRSSVPAMIHRPLVLCLISVRDVDKAAAVEVARGLVREVLRWRQQGDRQGP